MPPKKRPTSQNTGHKAKRTRLSEMAEKRPEQVGQQDPPPQMMSVDIQALSSSISVAVKQAVQEALTGNSATLSTNVSVPHPEQLADGAIEASLANLSGQGTQPTQPTLTQETIIINKVCVLAEDFVILRLQFVSTIQVRMSSISLVSNYED